MAAERSHRRAIGELTENVFWSVVSGQWSVVTGYEPRWCMATTDN